MTQPPEGSVRAAEVVGSQASRGILSSSERLLIGQGAETRGLIIHPLAVFKLNRPFIPEQLNQRVHRGPGSPRPLRPILLTMDTPFLSFLCCHPLPLPFLTGLLVSASSPLVLPMA